MSTLLEHALKLADRYPGGGPVYLSKMAEVFWPEANWLNFRVNRHNGGARRGARCAGALAGRLEKAGFLRMGMDFPRNYVIKVAAIRDAQKAQKSAQTKSCNSTASVGSINTTSIKD